MIVKMCKMNLFYLEMRVIKVLKKTKEELRKIQELRRSNAATPIKNKKQYSRKIKFKK